MHIIMSHVEGKSAMRFCGIDVQKHGYANVIEEIIFCKPILRHSQFPSLEWFSKSQKDSNSCGEAV